MTDADKLMEMAQDQLRQAAGHQVFGRDKRVTFHRGRADLFRRAAAALRKQDDAAALRADLAKAKEREAALLAEIDHCRRTLDAIQAQARQAQTGAPGAPPPDVCTVAWHSELEEAHDARRDAEEAEHDARDFIEAGGR